MRKSSILFILFFITSIVPAQEVNIIPQPASLQMRQGSFTITPNTYFMTLGSGMENSVNFLNWYLKSYYGFQLKKATKPRIENVIMLNYERMDNSIPGAYSLQIGKDNIQIDADNEQGLFYAMQTLIQLLPTEKKNALLVPQLAIVDSPRFAYRGMHLDVGRHFVPVDFIKKYIDYIALHKMNYFHWHLTEDQGWRIEIKKYPKLTQVGAWRNGTIIGRYPGTGNDNIKYGGFYTQKQIKEVVEYAQKRYVTIVPEIEMPGHSSAAIAAYPELSCFPNESTKHPKECAWSGDTTGKQVQQTWGVFEDVFCPSEFTFNFLENVLDEVIALFPSPYIHVGGDECPKESWKRSEFCQQLIKEKGLKDEHGLQSYFIQRIEKYINSKGKKLIGWDEILEGGLAPNAVVMSWRGEAGGIAAAKEKHEVIMTPENPVYFDHSQSQNEDSVTIGGYNPIEKVYEYEPIPKEISVENVKYVLGAQANVWTEYMKNTRKAENMIFPRLSALSEVLWSPKEKRNWNDFEKKLMVGFKRYDLWKSNYSAAYFDLMPSVLPTENFDGVQLKLESKLKEGTISLQKTIGNNTLTLGQYTNPIVIKESAKYTADFTISNYLIQKFSQSFSINKATGKKITLANESSKNYPGDGAFTLVNGVINEKGFAKSSEFLGYLGANCEAVIDLGALQAVSSVVVNALKRERSEIYRPLTTEAFGSLDGTSFYSLGLTDDFIETKNGKGTMTMAFKATYARYIKIIVTNWGTVPSGRPDAGNKTWLFVDEIEIR